MRKGIVSFVVLLMVAVIASGCSSTQTTEYPQKPIEIIVPWTAGGASDLTVRALAKGMEKELGQPVMVTNKEGAGGLTGAAYGVSAKPDGYTLVWIGGKNAAPDVYQSTYTYTAKDYQCVAQVSVGVRVLAVARDSKFQTLEEFVEYTKNTEVKYAHTGRGNGPHMAGVVLADTYGLRMTDVPYSSDAESLLALLRGDTEVAFMNLAAALPQEEAGEIRILAFLNREKVDSVAHIPSFNDTNYPIDTDVLVCNAICAPLNVPEKIVKTLEKAIEKAMQADEFKSTMGGLGVVTGYMNSAACTRSMADFIEKVGPIIQKVGIYK